MALNKKLLLGIPLALLLLAVIFYVPLKQTALQDTYPYVRQQYPLIQDYPFNTEGKSNVLLSDKIELSRLQDAKLTLRGCRLDNAESVGILTLNEKDYEMNFPNCDFLTFPDKGGEQPYIHYSPLIINLPIPEQHNLAINVDLHDSIELIEGKLTVSSYVECTRDAHCPEVANNCDVGGSYKCTLNNKPIEQQEYKKSNLNIYLIVALVAVSLIAVYYYRKK